MYKVKCGKCNGTGVVNCYRHHDAGVCYDCKGAGFYMRKTPPVDLIRFHVTAVVKPGYNNAGKRSGLFVNAKNAKDAMKKARMHPDCFDLETMEANPA